MGCPCHIYLIGNDEQRLRDIAQTAQNYVYQLERKYSRYLENSVITKINAAAGTGNPISIDQETKALLDYADNCFKQSEGLFDITSGVLRRAWDFKRQRIPEQTKIDALLPLIGWHKVKRTAYSVELTVPGMELDFGGVVKEYAADATATHCKVNNIQHGYIDLGGDISVIGPSPDNKPWPIGIRHPQITDKAIAFVDLHTGGLATSGDYERKIIIEGERYSHLLNPTTGWPLASDRTFASVSVVADQCLIAGTLSTVAMLKGTHKGKIWLDELALPYLVVYQDMRVESCC